MQAAPLVLHQTPFSQFLVNDIFPKIVKMFSILSACIGMEKRGLVGKGQETALFIRCVGLTLDGLLLCRLRAVG